MLEYLSWDVIQHETQPKFGDVSILLNSSDFKSRNQRYSFFLNENEVESAPPFIIFYKKNIDSMQISNLNSTVRRLESPEKQQEQVQH